MVNIQPIDYPMAKYNAVKVQVNDAKTFIPDDIKSDFGAYNAVDVQVNRPTVEVQKSSVYSYPKAQTPVTYDMAGISKVEVPALPISTDLYKDNIEVPEPNVTTVEAEKELAFHGINFKSAPVEKKTIEIIPSEEIKPDVDIQEAAKKLTSPDYDEQVKQMVEIVKSSKDKEVLNSYIAPEIFTVLIDTIKKDTSNLSAPTEEQKAVRKKITENLIAAEKAFVDGTDPKDFKFPHDISDEEAQLAISLTDLEMAERNKTYALAVTSLLAKAYADGVEEQTGNIIPLTDLPGTSAMVDVLRYNKNPDIKMTSIDSLRYIAKPEYNEDITTILTLAMQDDDKRVAQYAALAVMSLTENENAAKNQSA